MANSLSFFFSRKIAIGALLCLPIVSACANTTVFGLSGFKLEGNQTYNVWNNLSNQALEGTGNFYRVQPWEGDLGPTRPGQYASQISNAAVRAGLSKKEATANIYAGDRGLYFGGWNPDQNAKGGELNIDGNAIANLRTLTFFVEIGEVFEYDFYNHAFPILTVIIDNGTPEGQEVSLGVDMSDENNPMGRFLDSKDLGTAPGASGTTEDMYANLYGFQWDLSGFNGSVVSYMISFTPVQHSQIFGLRVDQTDHAYGLEFVAVPEPAAYALLLGAGVLGMIAVRRRRAK